MTTSVAYRNKLLEFMRGTAPSPPAGIWLSLHIGDPGATGANEVSTSGTGYNRLQLTFGPAASGQIANTNTPSQTFTGAVGTTANPVDHFGFYDAATGGNFIEGGSVTTPKAYGAGDTQTTAVGAYTISLS